MSKQNEAPLYISVLQIFVEIDAITFCDKILNDCFELQLALKHSYYANENHRILVGLLFMISQLCFMDNLKYNLDL